MVDILKELNEQQIIAVTAKKPVLVLGQVLAGPGSGKTRVLAYRIAYLIAVMGVQPYQIMAVTFTNKAAREMENRISGLLGDKAEGLWLGTFHAICGRILRREADHLPIDRNYVIFDSDDQISLVKRVVKEKGLNEKDYNPRQVLSKISSAKNELFNPEDFPIETYRDETIQAVYEAYQQYLVSSNAVDFDDMLLYTARLLETNQGIRESYGRRFQHILVDEFQDTNIAQYRIVAQLASFHKNLFVVGDEDQSIYRWRGADVRNIQRFKEDFPESGIILLEKNYRSTQTILDAATAVIDANPDRTKKNLESNRGTGTLIVAYEAIDDQDEAAYVVDTILQQVGQNKAKESDFAIMYRTNAQSRQLEEAFRRANMNYRLVGAQRFYGRREVKDLIAYLRLIFNPKDEVSLARVINLPSRGIGDVTLEALQSAAQNSGMSSGEVLLALSDEQSSYVFSNLGSAEVRLRPFSDLLAGWRECMSEFSLTELFDQIIQDIGYEEFINSESDEMQDRWANVLELRQVLFEYEDKGLAEFLESMALVADQDTLPDIIDAPTLLTLHAAKGLEFPQVFIIGLDENILPHSRSMDDPEELAEERRLLYVGMTRAMDRLFLTRALRRRSPYGSYETMQPSRFLQDIPANLIRGKFSLPIEQQDQYDLNIYRWDRPYGAQERRQSVKNTQPPAQRFLPEMRVEHPVYGEGIVRNSRLEYGDETVEVYFEGLGLKALVASMSSLVVLDE